ncbi:GNAT family protein [Bacillus sp. JCM 19041]|uniref:GNAT family N-acetyltransferase n=1 Tax=Bacillus sp. JCM 19041 TaxID=1460637 RepID=UPI0006D282F1
MSISFPEIETERLLLRRITSADRNDVFRYLSTEDVVKHMGIFPYRSAEAVQDEINWYDRIFQEGSGIRWGITFKGKKQVIGSCGFLNRKKVHFKAEIGYELAPEYWSKGIAGEALLAICTYGFDFLNMERIEALVEPENNASMKLLERCGFLKEGLLRHYEYTRNKFDDVYMYSFLKGDRSTF